MVKYVPDVADVPDVPVPDDVVAVVEVVPPNRAGEEWNNTVGSTVGEPGIDTPGDAVQVLKSGAGVPCWLCCGGNEGIMGCARNVR